MYPLAITAIICTFIIFKGAWQKASNYNHYCDESGYFWYSNLCVPHNLRSFLSPLKCYTFNFQQLAWLIQLTYNQLIDFGSLFSFYHFELEWNTDSDCREPRMWRLSSHWMRHRCQVIPARSFSWWQITLADARRENSFISQLSALCDNNNLILRLREEVRLSFTVLEGNMQPEALLSTKTNLSNSNMLCHSLFVTNSFSASGLQGASVLPAHSHMLLVDCIGRTFLLPNIVKVVPDYVINSSSYFLVFLSAV